MIQNYRFWRIFPVLSIFCCRWWYCVRCFPVGVAGAGGRAPRPRERVRWQVGRVVCRIPVPSAGGVGVI